MNPLVSGRGPAPDRPPPPAIKPPVDVRTFTDTIDCCGVLISSVNPPRQIGDVIECPFHRKEARVVSAGTMTTSRAMTAVEIEEEAERIQRRAVDQRKQFDRDELDRQRRAAYARAHYQAPAPKPAPPRGKPNTVSRPDPTVWGWRHHKDGPRLPYRKVRNYWWNPWSRCVCLTCNPPQDRLPSIVVDVMEHEMLGEAGARFTARARFNLEHRYRWPDD